VDNLEREKLELSGTVEALKEERQKIEAVLKWDELMLRSALSNALTRLKAEKPELFVLSGKEQQAILLELFLKAIFQR
ncbi:MAG: hypothetical protein ACUVTE_07450, partial [Candidatus Bathycorpusculaceae bacterium]